MLRLAWFALTWVTYLPCYAACVLHPSDILSGLSDAAAVDQTVGVSQTAYTRLSLHKYGIFVCFLTLKRKRMQDLLQNRSLACVICCSVSHAKQIIAQSPPPLSYLAAWLTPSSLLTQCNKFLTWFMSAARTYRRLVWAK